MSVDVVDEDGTPVSIKRLMLHHIVFAKLGTSPAGCDQYTAFDANQKLPAAAAPFYGAGEERNVLALPPGYGVKMEEKEPWLMVWMLMNHKKTTDKAFIEWKVTYDTDPDIQTVKGYWLDVVNCHADPIFNVPGDGGPGSTYTKTYDLTMPVSGRIIASGGHVHGGAKGLEISQPDCQDRTIIRSRPVDTCTAVRRTSRSRSPTARTARSSTPRPRGECPTTPSTTSSRSCTSRDRSR